MAAHPAGGPVIEAHGARIPKLGLGTFGLEGRAATETVLAALEVGYRHVDTAEMYGNERAVGEGLRAAAVPRDEVFLTTKVWHENLAPDRLMASAERSVAALGVGPVDLFLIHWPSPVHPLEAAVEALCGVQAAGLSRAVGVSNFPAPLLERALAVATVPLVADQVEYHPLLDQRALLAALRKHGMALTAYCPIARGRLAHDATMKRIAAAHGATVSQVALAWLIAQDRVAAIPKTSRPGRLRENHAALDLTLSQEERAAIDGLARADGRLIDPAFAPAWDR